MNGWILITGILIPLLGALLLPLFGKLSGKFRNIMALTFVTTAFILAVCALTGVLADKPFSARYVLPLGFSFGFLGDALAVFLAMTASFVSCIIVIYSFGYIHEYENQNEYYMMVCLFVGAMMGLVYSTNLIAIYTFWEISSLCCWRLIGFYREEITIDRANKTFIITVLGALIMLVGFMGIYSQTGTFDLTEMKGAYIPSWCVVLILFGILSKSATIPLHSWLPDAGVAPSPVTSLLHAAVLVKIGVYAYARFFVLTFEINEAFTTIVPVIAAVSALYSAGVAFRENDIKRVLAYSTISQLAFILLGLSCGEKIGIIGGLMYIMAHSVAKGGLFLCAGIVEHNIHTKDIRKMGGLAKTMPLTATAFALCACSIMGIPPFFGFFTKHMVIEGIVSSGNIVLGVLFVLCAVMTVMYLIRLFVKVFFGQQTFSEVKEGTPIMVVSVLILGIISLLLGFFSFLPSHLATMIWGLM
ncbi:MAG: NADH-quinone oxidoreductase subunit L [Bacillota bacterium]|nr:NADH-quinone oxidoreductase subunit L [Bacillota bacterium]